MRFIIAALLSTLLTPPAHAEKGFIRLKDGVERYVETTPARDGKPTLVLLNGLVYPISRWGAFEDDLKKNGYGVVNYYFRGQHLTLKKEAGKDGTPAFFATGLEATDFADELDGLLTALKIKSPVTLIGLSYGAHIAAAFAERYPARVKDVVFLAPLVVSLDHYSPEGQWVLWNLDVLKLTWGPFLGPVFYEAAYAQIYRNYLGSRIVPDKVPEEMADRPDIYKESIFHLVRAARDFDLRETDFSKISGHVHFMTAGQEDPPALADQKQAFDGLPRAQVGALLHFPKSWHAIPDSQGAVAGRWLRTLLEDGDSRIKSGTKYQVTGKGLAEWN